MNRHRKPPYRRPVSLVWRPAFERLNAALNEYLEGYYEEERRRRYVDYCAAKPAPQPERPIIRQA